MSKLQSSLLDKDRQIIELQKALTKEQNAADELRAERRDLKKYHIEEL